MTDLAEPHADGRNALEYASISDVGLRRANNQDTLAVALAGDDSEWRRRGHLFLVADGMGAHAAGELASKMAGESVPHTYRKSVDRAPPEALKLAITAANAAIHERGQANAEFQGMGTTCSALVLLPQAAIVAHVGDSRVYRVRAGKIEQLTFDHSLVWEMMAAGQMPRGEVANFIPKNIITRSLGPRADVQVDVEGPFPLQPGDVFLLCSDGLTGQVKDEELGAIVSALAPAEAVQALVDMANLRGGPDNVTVVIVRVQGVPSGEEQPAQPVAAPGAPGSIVSQLLWIAMGLGLLVALLLAFGGNPAGGLAVGLAASVAGVAALVHNLLRTPARVADTLSGPYGAGPHAEFVCAPDPERAAMLCQMAQQLREAAKDEHWTLDWGRFNAFGERAQAALAAGDAASAVREYALAISFMMSEIRRQPSRKDRRDSSVLDL